jgi:YidC/Oxa1 family membrane protein insertase
MSVFAVLGPALAAAYHAVTAISAVLVPVLAGAAPATAIVVFTALVRLCLHPLNRSQADAQARAEQARAALAPDVKKLARKHKNDPARLQRETFDLYRRKGVPLTAGFLPALAQIPVLMVMYRLFVSPTIGGHRNALLTDKLFGVGLGSHFHDVLTGATASASHIAVFVALFAAIGAIATWSFLRMRAPAAEQATQTQTQPAGALGRLFAFLPFGTILTAAIVPLATGIYLATTTLWTVVERRHLAQRAQQRLHTATTTGV